MNNNLKQLYHIQEVLKEKGYLDISRISNEILEFSKNDNPTLPEILERLKKDEPWEYIRGEIDFLNNRFIVNKNVLIPRIETEELVLLAKDFLQENIEYKQVVDVGTGSGCIIISLANFFCNKNQYRFLATDIDMESLEVAKENSVLHKINEKVAFLKSNLIQGVDINNDCLIVANLPYVPTNMYMKLDKSVLGYEPSGAIDGGEDGLKYYRLLFKQIRKKLENGIKIALLIEIEPSTLDNLKKLIGNNEYFVKKDFRRVDRFVLIHFS